MEHIYAWDIMYMWHIYAWDIMYMCTHTYMYLIYIYILYNDKCGPTNPTMVVHKQKVQGYISSVYKDRCLIWFSVYPRILKL